MRERDHVLVFGAATIFGSRLVERLVERRMPVIAVDDLRIGAIENLSRALDSGITTFVYARTLDDPDIVRSALVDARCGDIAIVHHCADPATVDIAVEIAAERRARSIVAVRAAGFEVSSCARLPTCVTLLHGIYGPHVFETALLGRMFEAALRREPVPAREGAVMPPLTYIDDAVDAMLAAMSRTEYGIFDVAAVRNVLEEDVAASLAAMCGSRVAVEPGDHPDDPGSRWRPTFPEPSGWVPRVSLHDGLRRTWRALAAEMILAH